MKGKEHAITKIRSLLEGDERLRGAWRKAMAGGDPLEVYKAMKRLRHQTSEVVDKWDELKRLNQQASRVNGEVTAKALVGSAIRDGYYVVASGATRDARNAIQYPTIVIFAPSKESINPTTWVQRSRPAPSGPWPAGPTPKMGAFFKSNDTVRRWIEDFYDELTVRAVDQYMPPSSFTELEVDAAIPKFAVVTRSALPSRLKAKL